MLNEGDNDRTPHHSIRSTDRPLSVQDQALLSTPPAQALAKKYPAWGPERIKAEIQRTN